MPIKIGKTNTEEIFNKFMAQFKKNYDDYNQSMNLPELLDHTRKELLKELILENPQIYTEEKYNDNVKLSLSRLIVLVSGYLNSIQDAKEDVQINVVDRLDENVKKIFQLDMELSQLKPIFMQDPNPEKELKITEINNVRNAIEQYSKDKNVDALNKVVQNALATIPEASFYQRDSKALEAMLTDLQKTVQAKIDTPILIHQETKTSEPERKRPTGRLG